MRTQDRETDLNIRAATTENQVIAELAAGAVEIKRANDGAPFVLVPEGYTLAPIEHTLLAPHRPRGTTDIQTLAHFCAFVQAHAADAAALPPGGKPVIFYDVDRGKGAVDFSAILNWDTWRDWRARYIPEASREWKIWLGSNKRTMTQTDFAQFIEDNAPDIVSPTSAEMIELSRSIEAKKKVNFQSGIRLSDGQTELTYQEAIEGSGAKGKMKIPETFDIGIPVFDGDERYKVTARLRYRINDQAQLALWYDLLRYQVVADDAIKRMVEVVRAAGVPVYAGESPPIAAL